MSHDLVKSVRAVHPAIAAVIGPAGCRLPMTKAGTAVHTKFHTLLAGVPERQVSRALALPCEQQTASDIGGRAAEASRSRRITGLEVLSIFAHFAIVPDSFLLPAGADGVVHPIHTAMGVYG